MPALHRATPPLLVGLLLLSAAALGAESLAVCVFRAVDLSSTAENNQYQGILTELLNTELHSAGYRVLPPESWDPVRERRGYSDVDLLAGEKALAVAAEAQAQVALLGYYRVEARQVVLEIKCYDVQAAAFVTGVLRTGRLNLSMYNLIDGAVKELLPQIRLIGQAPALPAPAQAEQITLISPDEGAEILLAGSQPVGAIEEGSLVLPPIPFPLGSAITVEKRKPGYHPSRESLLIQEPVQSFKLRPLRRQARWATELNWTFGQVLGFGLAQRYYLKPDITFIAAEHYFYLQHNFAGGLPVFHHDLRALFGVYVFTGPDSVLRLGMSTGVGFILTYFAIPDQGAFTDFYLNLVNVSLELNFPRFLVHLRSEGRYALGIGKDLLGRGWLNVANGPPPISLGVVWKW
jgi:hypothetical protein